MRDVIVEIRGGVLVEIYADAPDTRIFVVDWDRLDGVEGATPGFEWAPTRIASMPQDTNAEYRTATSSSPADDCILAHAKEV